MFERVLVALDGSKNSEMVLPYVEEIAGKFHSELSLVGVVENENVPITSPGGINNDVLNVYLTEKARQVAEEAKEFGLKSVNQITFKLFSGNIAQKILAYSDEINAGLIALTSRGISSHEKWVLGNVASKILRAAKKPVLLVRYRASDNALNARKLVKNILIPLDGSKIGEAAIQISEALAIKLNAKLVLIHVLEPITKFGMYDTNPNNPSIDNLNFRQAEAKEYLDQVMKSIKERTGLITGSVVTVGYPANEIADYSKNHDIDLIAVSTHGRTGLKHWVFGSVTDKILHFGDTPVLVVRPSKI